jgi:DNA-directed RNA polymerase subunit RPC12/RpoP
MRGTEGGAMALFGKKKDEKPVSEATARRHDTAEMWREAAKDPEALKAAVQRQSGGRVDPSAVTAAARPSSGDVGWIGAVLHPQSEFARRCTCETCGGSKRLPSPTAYMYCDYCGSLADFDFRALVRASSDIADRAAYAATMNRIGPESNAARSAGDREAYARLRNEFYDAWLTATPKAASHRVGDPAYRSGFVAYMVARAMATDFDPSYQATEQGVKTAAQGLRYSGMQVEPDSFWPLLDVCIQQQERAESLCSAAGVEELDPDRASDAVRRKIAMSAMAQGWITTLSADAGEELLSRTGLAGEYQRLEPVVDGTTRHCGQCGSEFTAVSGATTVVCDSCGHRLDVGTAELACTNCGGLVSLPAGANDSPCPYCKTLVSRVGR